MMNYNFCTTAALTDSQFQSPTGPLTPITYVKMANDSVKIITQNLTWSEAKARCQQDGAYLASIRNEWTRAYIELQAINLNSSLWIGLNKGEVPTKIFFFFIIIYYFPNTYIK